MTWTATPTFCRSSPWPVPWHSATDFRSQDWQKFGISWSEHFPSEKAVRQQPPQQESAYFPGHGGLACSESEPLRSHGVFTLPFLIKEGLADWALGSISLRKISEVTYMTPSITLWYFLLESEVHHCLPMWRESKPRIPTQEAILVYKWELSHSEGWSWRLLWSVWTQLSLPHPLLIKAGP